MKEEIAYTKSINNALRRTRWMKLKYLFVCFFKLSGKNDRNAWLRKNKIFGLFGEDSNYQPHTLPNNPRLVKIHNNVRVAEGVTFYEHDGINNVFARMNGTVDTNGVCIKVVLKFLITALLVDILSSLAI